MKNKYLLLSIALLASGTTLVAMNNDPAKKATYQKSFKCDYPGCDYAATQKANFSRHKLTHTGEKPYKCDYDGCDYATTQMRILKMHMLTHPPPIKCTQLGCNYVQPGQARFKAHTQTHPTCTHCNQALLNDTSLLKHVQKHLDANRILQLQQNNPYIQDAFSAYTLLNMDRK